MSGYSCAVEFDTSGADFVRGVEVGRLWEMLKTREDTFEEIVHASNAEMVLRLSEATGRRVRSQELDETWILAVFDAG